MSVLLSRVGDVMQWSEPWAWMWPKVFTLVLHGGVLLLCRWIAAGTVLGIYMPNTRRSVASVHNKCSSKAL